MKENFLHNCPKLNMTIEGCLQDLFLGECDISSEDVHIVRKKVKKIILIVS